MYYREYQIAGPSDKIIKKIKGKGVGHFLHITKNGYYSVSIFIKNIKKSD